MPLATPIPCPCGRRLDSCRVPGDLFERLAYGDPLGESEKKRCVSDILEGVGGPGFRLRRSQAKLEDFVGRIPRPKETQNRNSKPPINSKHWSQFLVFQTLLNEGFSEVLRGKGLDHHFFWGVAYFQTNRNDGVRSG